MIMQRCAIVTALLGVCSLALLLRPGLALERPVVISTWQGPCSRRRLSRPTWPPCAGWSLWRSERGSDFVVFPETFLSGYGDLETVERGARRMDDPEYPGS